MEKIIYLVALIILLPTVAAAQWQIKKDSTTFKIPVHAAKDTDHTPKTDVGSLTCNLVKNGADVSCAGSSAEVDDTNAPGAWSYTVGAGDTDTAGASLVFYFTATGMDPFRAPAQIGPITANVIEIQGATVGALYDGTIVDDNPASKQIDLAANAVDADDQFNGSLLSVFDTAGSLKAKSCIFDSANTNERVTTAEDLAALIADGDSYTIEADGGCAANVTAWNMTNVPAAHTTGYPIVTIKDGTGTGEIDTTSGAVIAGSLGTTAKSDVNAEVVDVMTVDTVAELSACPTASAPMRDKLTYIYQYFRHKVTSTATAMTLFKDDGSTTLCSDTLSDNGTTFTRGEMN